jgi:hypothetical protein
MRILSSQDRSVEMPHVLGAMACLVGFGLEIYSVIMDPSHHFDMVAFGEGVLGLFTASGVFLFGQGAQRWVQDKNGQANTTTTTQTISSIPQGIQP